MFPILRKAKANLTATAERQALHLLVQEAKSQQATLDSANDNLGVAQRKLEKLELDEAKLDERRATVRQFFIIDSLFAQNGSLLTWGHIVD